MPVANSPVQRCVKKAGEVDGNALCNLSLHDLEVPAVACTYEDELLQVRRCLVVVIPLVVPTRIDLDVGGRSYGPITPRPTAPRCCAPLAFVTDSGEKRRTERRCTRKVGRGRVPDESGDNELAQLIGKRGPHRTMPGQPDREPAPQPRDEPRLRVPRSRARERRATAPARRSGWNFRTLLRVKKLKLKF